MEDEAGDGMGEVGDLGALVGGERGVIAAGEDDGEASRCEQGAETYGHASVTSFSSR